ncbi:hypothetical protein GGR58DRAFT_232579 [Xylaria digitata]|nr:hypothetical protein GGR58DRAFT_232579 [Xylaria digitata]
MLMPILEAIGERVEAPLLRKRVRDEVNLRNADLPWRWLPFWLVLRVAAQRSLCLALGNQQGRVGYKLLMRLLLADLLKESAERLGPELVVMLRAKICRRMAKLEMDMNSIPASEEAPHYVLFNCIRPIVTSIIQDATARVERAWESFKLATTRQVPRLPQRTPTHALQLCLPNSSQYLANLLSGQPFGQPDLASLDLPRPLDKSIRQTQAFIDHMFRLASMEATMDRDHPHDSHLPIPAAHCLQLVEQIDSVFTEVGTAYDGDPEQMSAMILSTFTLWTRLDKCVIAECPLLGDHRPVFTPELLDALQLPILSKMQQLHDIQAYLSQRHRESRYRTILDKTGSNDLAMRFVSQSSEMQSLGACIQAASDEARNAKEIEWKTVCDQYDKHTAAIAEGTCCCSWRNGQRDVRGCTKCWHWRTRNRMKIQVHEEFLPRKEPARAAFLFELAVPTFLSAYRDISWRIIHKLAHPSRPANPLKPEIRLADCHPLRRFMTAKAVGISLASTIKCFAQTHYKFSAGKTPLSRVLLPLAGDFELYDQDSGLWVKDLCSPLTFQHLCGVYIPRGIRAAVISPELPPPATADGPSSYEIQANQSECPLAMSVHEFSACQKLLAGNVRRWPNILVELGSSNLNLSDEDTMYLVCQLAIQVGPELPGEVLRAVHVVFREPAFLERLAEMIEKRLRAILDNWRESNCMEILVTLSLRLFYLTSGAMRIRAESLLRLARRSALDWIARLRKEVRTASDADGAQRAATYGFLAALLCRRTFAVYADLDQTISDDDPACWIEASLALQENLLVDINSLPPRLKSMCIRDAKAAYDIQALLQNAVRSSPSSVDAGIMRSWSDSADGVTTNFSRWTFLPVPNDRWIACTISQTGGKFSYRQTVHYNIIEGHLLVNGRPRGKLPLEIRDHPAVMELFKDQHLMTYPSSLPGMTYRLASLVYDQEIHLGMRGS